MFKGLLPIGSVVLLKEDTHRLMVIGHCVVKENDFSTVYDYSACEFPEGFQDGEHIYMFNAEQIDKVDCIGFEDEKAEDWLGRMDEYITGLRNGTIKPE